MSKIGSHLKNFACRACAFLLALVVWVALGTVPARADTEPTLSTGSTEPAGPAIAVAVAVALEGEQPVVDAAWVDGQIAEANRLYADVPLRFVRVSLSAAPWLPAHVVTRQDRDRAAARLASGVVNLRVIASLMDVDERDRVRRGVHWRLRADPRRHCILLSAISAPSILAHELGHFFGNGHSPVTDNLMSYSRAGGTVALDDAQRVRVRQAARAYLRSGELVAPGDPGRKTAK